MRTDAIQLSQRTLALLPKRQRQALQGQVQNIAYIHALAEAASAQQAAALMHFATLLSATIDEVEQRVAPLDRLTTAQQRELEAQIDQLLASNRQLLDQAHHYALEAMREAAFTPTPAVREGWEAFMIGLSGSENNWNALRKAFGR